MWQVNYLFSNCSAENSWALAVRPKLHSSAASISSLCFIYFLSILSLINSTFSSTSLSVSFLSLLYDSVADNTRIYDHCFVYIPGGTCVFFNWWFIPFLNDLIFEDLFHCSCKISRKWSQVLQHLLTMTLNTNILVIFRNLTSNQELLLLHEFYLHVAIDLRFCINIAENLLILKFNNFLCGKLTNKFHRHYEYVYRLLVWTASYISTYWFYLVTIYLNKDFKQQW